ncbi:PE-PGRS family domain protein [Mycobacterium ulcerans str. Harvey]|uniref:PE-PGRS family domain protein n=1 Tax=Mycobacterium ulcerans str. Harvey TaxID=1299332 RepID=A0ABN0QM85_MYCUL|nr:PE-PGRS family domain protein [Mycobacterium ulcerans str. Harvey]
MLIIDKTSSGNPAIYSAPTGLASGSTTTLQDVGTLALPSGSSYLVTGPMYRRTERNWPCAPMATSTCGIVILPKTFGWRWRSRRLPADTG